MNTTFKVLMGVAAGTAAGLIAGILFAPDKGSETRKKIGQKMKGLADEMKEKFRKAEVRTGDIKAGLSDALTKAHN